MISLPTDMPLIRIGDDSITLCRAEWITNKLTSATDGTNVPDWLAEDISRGVEQYLTNHYRGTVIGFEELFEQIGTTLSNMGLPQVAANMDKTPPPVRISLNALARRAGSGYELAFFKLLEAQFYSAANGGATSFECHGLDNCVRRLAANQKWGKRCELLKAEIEQFIADKKEQASIFWPQLDISIAESQ